MKVWQPEPVKPRRAFNLHATERRATERILVAAVWLVRAAVLTKYLAGDVRARIRGDRP